MTDNFFVIFTCDCRENIFSFMLLKATLHHLRLPLSHSVSNTPSPLFTPLRFFRTFYLLFTYEYLLFFVDMCIVCIYIFICVYIICIYVYTHIYTATYLQECSRLNIRYHCVISDIVDKY